MVKGELRDPLSAYNPFGNGFTLFLPTDEAFDRYIQNNPNYNSFEELVNDKDFVRILGRYHLVNTGLETNEFPYGALPDTTATGDLLTIGFSSDTDTTVYLVNSIANESQGIINVNTSGVYIESFLYQFKESIVSSIKPGSPDASGSYDYP